MASEVYINIKDLPELTEVNNGDYIIVETSTGTHIINFENFLIPTNNTVISTTVTQNSSSFSSSISQLSSAINSLNSSFVKVGKGTVTIPPNNTRGTATVNIPNKTYTKDNVIIVPANKYAAKNNAYVVSVDNSSLITIEGSFYSTTATLNTVTSAITLTDSYTPASESAIYKVYVLVN